jgi:ABC-2 type transport system permease protein
VNISVRNWFNVNLEYRWYVLTVIVALLALVVTLLLTALSVARERELGTFDQLIITPLSSFEILLGKTIPPFVLALTVTSVMSFLAVIVFKIPFAGNPFYLFGAIAVSLLSIVGVGLSISSIAKTQQQAILGIITFQMPAVLLSGFVSPVEDMPQFLQILTYANPLRFFIKITRCIFLKGMILEDIIMNLIPLIIIACITLSFAAWMFKKRLD